MGQSRYTEAFKIEAVCQVTEAGHRVYDVANQLGISNKSLHHWIKICGPKSNSMQTAKPEQKELKKLKAELETGHAGA